MSADCLVYVDASPRGEWALGLAALLPGRERRRLVLLATAEDAAAHADLLSRARAQLSGFAGCEERVRPGPAERAVVAEAGERRYALVVVPPAGRNALQRLLRGSRVATVVRQVRAPVLVARRPPKRLGRILAAVSAGPTRDVVCEAALELGLAANAAVSFLHVEPAVALPFGPPGGGGAPSGPEAAGSQDRIRSALAARGWSGGLLVREGLVAEQVLAEFEAGAYDLLAIGAAGEAALGKEDVSELLLLRCPGSLLIVPRA